MIGAIGKCKDGKIGVICKMSVKNSHGYNHVLYTGVTFDGKAWQSVDPEILSPTLNDYLETYFHFNPRVLNFEGSTATANSI